jgi:hypothetical protein
MNPVSAFGIGLDIAGGTIVAVGLVGHPGKMALRSTTFFGGAATTAAGEAESRADAEVGIPALALGFICQLVGFG